MAARYGKTLAIALKYKNTSIFNIL